ncbi:hypothetical protein GLAREA_12941 [Glarea lozoyensis ATCC 20868]|uniref:Uncharacterized protein n=1 Tax=Glarea lozoyensis (strain ATCC 20868 / MF5171) TaxID=1116229 RepID=S3DUY7_GLAL2|nr:uncharacterized protein GLAREA_12941 [Glarea lozoyensis ATCC 20868]EPE30218.1 hypothetical protein GLAREA_12941 [Glarea lozoyensis ATCC 20868]
MKCEIYLVLNDIFSSACLSPSHTSRRHSVFKTDAEKIQPTNADNLRTAATIPTLEIVTARAELARLNAARDGRQTTTHELRASAAARPAGTPALQVVRDDAALQLAEAELALRVASAEQGEQAVAAVQAAHDQALFAARPRPAKGNALVQHQNAPLRGNVIHRAYNEVSEEDERTLQQLVNRCYKSLGNAEDTPPRSLSNASMNDCLVVGGTV